MAARLLHAWSPRADNAFVTVNSARITPERFEQELFGEEADGKLVRAGLLEMADGGTLYVLIEMGGCSHALPEDLPAFVYTTLPLLLPQMMSYTLYRWENNIRAAAVLGVVGAGGLGQMLAFHMGLFQMGETSSVLVAMMALVALVDAASHLARRLMSR